MTRPLCSFHFHLGFHSIQTQWGALFVVHIACLLYLYSKLVIELKVREYWRLVNQFLSVMFWFLISLLLGILEGKQNGLTNQS